MEKVDHQQLKRIAGLRAIRSLSWRQRGQQAPWERLSRLPANMPAAMVVVRIEFQPLVLEARCHRYLAREIACLLPLSGALPRWECPHHRSPHPHIGDCGTACYGQAEEPLRRALQQHDFLTAAILLSGWLRSYRPTSDAMSPISRLPRSELEAGWRITS